MSPEEVEVIVRVLRPRCVRWARRQVHDGAEDVAQAALEALFRHAADVEIGVAVSWLRQAVYLNGLQYLRARRGEVALSGEGSTLVDQAPDPEDAVASAELAACVRDALGGVVAQRRSLLVAVLLDEQTLAEVRSEGGGNGAAGGLLDSCLARGVRRHRHVRLRRRLRRHQELHRRHRGRQRQRGRQR